MAGRRDEKKRETRQRISDVATTLFFARGFEAVTLEEIATAAKVAKMTVFNYFPRKEDLMLDRHDDLRMVLLCNAIRSRPAGRSPGDALRVLFGELAAQRHSFTQADRRTAGWWKFVLTSSSLRARLREFDEQAGAALATELGGPEPDSRARLAAGTIVLAVRTAREELVRAADRGASDDELTAVFAAVFDQGLAAADRLIEPRQP